MEFIYKTESQSMVESGNGLKGVQGGRDTVTVCCV